MPSQRVNANVAKHKMKATQLFQQALNEANFNGQNIETSIEGVSEDQMFETDFPFRAPDGTRFGEDFAVVDGPIENSLELIEAAERTFEEFTITVNNRKEQIVIFPNGFKI